MDNPVKILIVDDDKNIRKTILAILLDEGFKVDLAASGREAIRKTQDSTYNVALLDIKLPDMEGKELLSKIRETAPKMRKLMVTGFTTQEKTPF